MQLGMQSLIDIVIDQIVRDIDRGHQTAIETLLRNVPVKHLEGYLSDEI